MQLFQEEAPEIWQYIESIWLELTQSSEEPRFSPLNLALALEFLGILQSDAAHLELISVQISAYRLEILLRSLQAKKVVETNQVEADWAFSRGRTLNSKLKKDLLEAGYALRLSLLPYLHPERAATAPVAIETIPAPVSQDNQLDSHSTRELELPTLDEFNLLSELENIQIGSSELTIQTANLLVWLVGSELFLVPYERIETTLRPQGEQIIQLEGQDFLLWQQQTIPIYRLAQLLEISALPELNSRATRPTVGSPQMKLILIIKQGQQLVAIESAIERLVRQPELIIQPVANSLSYCYGLSDWEDGSWVRVIDLEFLLPQLGTQMQPIDPVLARSVD